MPKAHNPRHGSMQFWPRKRAKKETPRVRSWVKSKEALPLGFSGYKAGMTHIIAIDNRAKSPSKGQEIALPVTVIECPPIKIAEVHLYKQTQYGKKLSKIIHIKSDKELKRRKTVAKKTDEAELDKISPEEYNDIRIAVYTQPKQTGIGKKKPEIYELGLGGNNSEKLNYIKEHLNKEIRVSEIFKPGQLVDTLAVTKGKGFQGPVKRFGVSIRSHKSEKTIRGPGSLGGWKGHAHFMYRNAQAGQTGYHQRIEFNKWILKISDKPEEINPKGGFLRYGNVKSEYMIVKGSVQGPKKRLIRFNVPKRPDKNVPKEAPSIVHTNLESKQ
ncbi:50S ribosomal protein L3 [Candidatus Woesearchaeota archaeon CG10_big_fil_rev_8_21_14_0_10_34_8]|nr:MAG: 50S ribosomal protein L3 [Candidatus Woesearchaeota archaeon CG10_big_fil_rev_8_21_14_0_10_34_8]